MNEGVLFNYSYMHVYLHSKNCRLHLIYMYKITHAEFYKSRKVDESFTLNKMIKLIAYTCLYSLIFLFI